MCKHFVKQKNASLTVKITCLPNDSNKTVLAKFDGEPIFEVVESQLSTCTNNKYIIENLNNEMELIVFCPKQTMGDNCELTPAQPAYTQAEYQEVYQLLNRSIEENKSAILIDLACANGADSDLVEYLISKQFAWQKLTSYASWNTPGNSIGSAIATGVATVVAKNNKQFNANKHQQLLFTRLFDDWGYQSEVRKELREKYPTPITSIETVTEDLNLLMKKQEAKIAYVLDNISNKPTGYQLPCQRFFEVEILW